MKRSKLLVTVTMLLLLFTCFLPVPSISGEDPWDADDSDGGVNQVPIDSIQLPELTSSSMERRLPVQNYEPLRVDWFTGLMVKVSFAVINYVQGGTSKKAPTYKAF